MFDLNDGNFLIYAAKCYDRPHILQSEFEDDLKRIKYVKRLLRKYRQTGEKREQGINRAADKLAKEETISEKAPPGAKFERMVKHIKKGYEKDGLTKKEKSIAYATAWKAKKREEQGE